MTVQPTLEGLIAFCEAQLVDATFNYWDGGFKPGCAVTQYQRSIGDEGPISPSLNKAVWRACVELWGGVAIQNFRTTALRLKELSNA